MLVNRCFEDLERRVGLKRAWEFVLKVGTERNERAFPEYCSQTTERGENSHLRSSMVVVKNRMFDLTVTLTFDRF